MAASGMEEPSGRETRLLVLVIAVALAVLLLLARFRFPSAEVAVSPSSAPLAGLVARGTFDEMADTMVGVFTHVSPAVVVVALADVPADTPPARGTRGRRPATPVPTPPADQPRPSRRLLPALRVRGNLAVVLVPQGTTPVTAGGLDTQVDAITIDPDRHLALLRTGGRPGPDGLAAATRTFAGFSYAAVVEAVSTGPTVRPVFVGRADPVSDPQWPQGVTAIGDGEGLTPGSLLFAMNGRFIGILADTESGLAIIPVSAIEAFVDTAAGADQGGLR